MSADFVRDTLCRMMEHDRSLLDDPRRVEGLLRDLCPKDRREVNLLVSALREGIPAALFGSTSTAAPLAAIERMTRKLEEHQGLAAQGARWAVESWALALGVIAAEALRPHASTTKEAAEPPRPAPAKPSVPKWSAGADYYEILGVPRHATPQEIERAHGNVLARLRESGMSQQEIDEQFRLAAEAYAVLSNPEKRLNYARFGRAGPGAGFFHSKEDVTRLFGDLFGKLSAKTEPQRAVPRAVGELCRLQGHTNSVTSVAFSSDGRRFASGSDDGTVIIWDVSSRQPLKKYTQACFRSTLGFAPGPLRVFWGCLSAITQDVVFQCYDISSANAEQWLPTAHKDYGSVLSRPANPITAMAISADGTALFAGDSAACWRAWNNTTGEQALAFEPGWFSWVSKMLCATFFHSSSTGPLVAAGYDDRTIRLWNLSNGQEVRQFKGHEYGVSGAAFSPDGRRC